MNGVKKTNGISGDPSNRVNKEKRENQREEIFNEIVPEHFLGLKIMILHIIEAELKCPAKTDF